MKGWVQGRSVYTNRASIRVPVAPARPSAAPWRDRGNPGQVPISPLPGTGHINLIPSVDGAVVDGGHGSARSHPCSSRIPSLLNRIAGGVRAAAKKKKMFLPDETMHPRDMPVCPSTYPEGSLIRAATIAAGGCGRVRCQRVSTVITEMFSCTHLCVCKFTGLDPAACSAASPIQIIRDALNLGIAICTPFNQVFLFITISNRKSLTIT